MKNLKHLLKILLAVTILVTMGLGLFGCIPEDLSIKGEITIIIKSNNENETTEYSVDSNDIKDFNEKTNIFDILMYLKTNENLEIKAEASSLGNFITELGILKPNSSSNEFIAIYTTDSKNFNVSQDTKEFQYNHKKFVTSLNSVDKLKAKGGQAYLFQIEKF